MEEKLKEILLKLKEINYGWVDKYNTVHKKSGRDYYMQNYRLQTIEETLEFKVGTCWEQVELARYYLECENIPCKTYIIIYNDDVKIARHTICTVEFQSKICLLENSWKAETQNLQLFENIDEILNMYVEKFPAMYKIYDFDLSKIEIYEYTKPETYLTYDEFSAFCRSCKKIK